MPVAVAVNLHLGTTDVDGLVLYHSYKPLPIQAWNLVFYAFLPAADLFCACPVCMNRLCPLDRHVHPFQYSSDRRNVVCDMMLLSYVVAEHLGCGSVARTGRYYLVDLFLFNLGRSACSGKIPKGIYSALLKAIYPIRYPSCALQQKVGGNLWTLAPCTHTMFTASILLLILRSFSFLYVFLRSSDVNVGGMPQLGCGDQNMFLLGKFDHSRTFA